MSGLLEKLRSMYARDAIVLAGIENGSVLGIPLTQGKIAIVDSGDCEWLSQWKWCAALCDKKYYALRRKKINGTKIAILMHRVILGFEYGDGKLGDHRNGNGLDNRRSNLREASPTLNSFNCKMKNTNTSGYRGVYWKKNNQNWQAQITIRGKAIHCGVFPTKEEAARAFDKAAFMYRGNEAILNFGGESHV